MSRPGRVRTQWRDGTKCDHRSDEPCEKCDAARARPIAAPFAVSFGEQMFEHLFPIDEKVRPITSREELRQECVARGLQAQTLEDSMTFRGGPDRWI